MSARVIAVVMTLKAPFFENENEDLFAMDNTPADVPWVEVEDCSHTATICPQCVNSWAQDHELAGVVMAGPDGVRTLTFDDISNIIKSAGETLTAFLKGIIGEEEEDDGSGSNS